MSAALMVFCSVVKKVDKMVYESVAMTADVKAEMKVEMLDFERAAHLAAY